MPPEYGLSIRAGIVLIPVMALTQQQQRLVRRDPRLQSVFEATGPRPRFYRQPDVYLGLLASVMAQQLSGKAADTIFGRFLNLFPDRYPAPDILMTLTDEALRGAGVSRQKATYVREIARFARTEGLSRTDLAPLADEQVIDRLTRIKGVGRWTAEMILMFSLGRPDVLPVDDLGIQQAMIRLYGLRVRGPALRRRMVAIAEAWRPHRTYVCCCLWRWKA